MKNKIGIFNVTSGERRFAYLKEGKLEAIEVERQDNQQITGNIYKGKINNLLPNIQSAFVDIAESSNGFIHVSDIVENTKKFEEQFALDFEFLGAKQSKKSLAQAKDINKHFKAGQWVLVQVVKESLGSKGARLTSNLSISGRFLVLLPNTLIRGVSRKITDVKARDKLKKLIKKFELPNNIGLICRTKSVDADEEQLIEEAHHLLAIWEKIAKEFNERKTPGCLFKESDLVSRALHLAYDRHIQDLYVDNQKTYKELVHLHNIIGRRHSLEIHFYRDNQPIFAHFSVDKELEKTLSRKIQLMNGGYLFIERTEAMFTIDVNSGRSVVKEGKTNLEESLIQINLEAATEIARQIRLRNMGGLIVIDFIDLRSRKGQRRIIQQLKSEMQYDTSKCMIMPMSEFGLVEMTRQKTRRSLTDLHFTQCPYCNGKGLIKNYTSVEMEIERSLLGCSKKGVELLIRLHPMLKTHLQKPILSKWEKALHKKQIAFKIKGDDSLHLNDFEIIDSSTGDVLV